MSREIKAILIIALLLAVLSGLARYAIVILD